MPKTPRLREWRERAALSQEELRDRSRVSRATIADLEAGNRGAQPRTVRRLAEALNVEPEDLYEEADSPKDEGSPSVQLTLNGLLAEERSPTDREIEALNRHLAYVERRLDQDSMTRDEANDELDVSRVFWRTVKVARNPELTDRHMAITQRVFDKAKELKARHLAAAEGVLEDMREWRKQQRAG